MNECSELLIIIFLFYFIGIPGPPLNLTVQQQNGSHVLLSWQPPSITKGPIQYYEICYSPPHPPVQVKLNDNGTAHLLTVDFEPGESYSFYVIEIQTHITFSLSSLISCRSSHIINTMKVKNLMLKRLSTIEILQ